MSTKKIIAVLLIALGIVALGYGGITYTKRDKIIDAGPIQATATHQKTVPVSPIVGVVALVGGVVLLMGSRRD